MDDHVDLEAQPVFDKRERIALLRELYPKMNYKVRRVTRHPGYALYEV
jgi:hypothetical protein